MDQIPTSTQWTRDAAGDAGRDAIDSVYLIQGKDTQSQGTGFLLDNGLIITNQHVIEGNDVGQIVAFSSQGDKNAFRELISDSHRDLAALEPKENLEDGLLLQLSDPFSLGDQVITWGYPIGFDDPAPLLSVGYLAGFDEETTVRGSVKQLVINGAFNNGNSGGPLFVSNQSKVIGVVFAKHAPLTNDQRWILDFLEDQVMVNWKIEQQDGTEQRVSLSQMITEYLRQHQQLAQLMIGHALTANEVADFLEENGCSIPA